MKQKILLYRIWLLDGRHQAALDDKVVLGQDVEGDMFFYNHGNGGSQSSQVVNIGCISVNGISQSSSLKHYKLSNQVICFYDSYLQGGLALAWSSIGIFTDMRSIEERSDLKVIHSSFKLFSQESKLQVFMVQFNWNWINKMKYFSDLRIIPLHGSVHCCRDRQAMLFESRSCRLYRRNCWIAQHLWNYFKSITRVSFRSSIAQFLRVQRSNFKHWLQLCYEYCSET